MSDLAGELFGEALLYVFGPVIAIFAVIALICSPFQSCHKKEVAKRTAIQNENIEVKRSIPYRVGHGTKEAGKDFVRGFFSK